MYHQSELSNGLKLATVRLSGRESVGLAIWVRVGGRYESRRDSGLSHFLEHMLFKGTKRRTTKQIKEQIEGVGGMFNAFTGEESTCYYVKIPKKHLRQAFDVLQDMVNESVLDEKEFQKERTVILEEIKMYMDLPAQWVQELMSELLWPKQPLGQPITGTLETVAAFERADLVRHKKSYYHPANFLVTAGGEIEHAELEQMAAEAFLNQMNGKPSRFKPAAERKIADRFHFMDKKTEQTHFVIGFHGLSRKNPGRFQLALLNIILGANMSSRLFEEVRERRGLAYEIKSGVTYLDDTGALTISAGVEPNKAPLTVRVIMRELSKLKKKPVTAGELRRAKDYFMGQLMLGLEDTLDHALWYGERVLYNGTILKLAEIQAEIERVTADEIREVAGRVMQSDLCRLSLIGPLGKNTESIIKKECVCE